MKYMLKIFYDGPEVSVSFTTFYTTFQQFFYFLSAFLLHPFSILFFSSTFFKLFYFLSVVILLCFSVFSFHFLLPFIVLSCFSSALFLTFLLRYFFIPLQHFCFSLLPFTGFRTFYFEFILQPRTKRILVNLFFQRCGLTEVLRIVENDES